MKNRLFWGDFGQFADKSPLLYPIYITYTKLKL